MITFKGIVKTVVKRVSNYSREQKLVTDMTH